MSGGWYMALNSPRRYIVHKEFASAWIDKRRLRRTSHG